jgi:hypothetical protein
MNSSDLKMFEATIHDRARVLGSFYNFYLFFCCSCAVTRTNFGPWAAIKASRLLLGSWLNLIGVRYIRSYF